jgi:hypothetical protein
MKKWFGITSLLLTLSLVLVNFSSVSAKSSSVTGGGQSIPDPTAVGISGDMSFTVTVLEATALDGIQSSEDMVYPAGFKTKEEQFIGNGLSISDHAYGEANACFTFSSATQGWSGNVYQWNGKSWVKLATTVNTSGESMPTACATFYGNGELALIGGVIHPKAETVVLPSCDVDGELMPGAYVVFPVPAGLAPEGGYSRMGFRFYVVNPWVDPIAYVPAAYVQAWVENISPEGSILPGKFSGGGRTDSMGETATLVILKYIDGTADTHFRLRIAIENKCQFIFDE